MRKLLVLFALVFALCVSADTYAQEEEVDWLAGIALAAEPSTALKDIVLEGVEWIRDHGEVAYFYNLGGSNTGSETIAKLTLFTAFDFVNLDVAATIPLETLDKAPGLAGGVGVKLSGVLEKFDIEWNLRFDISIGYLGGYRWKDWMHGPTLGVSGRF